MHSKTLGLVLLGVVTAACGTETLAGPGGVGEFGSSSGSPANSSSGSANNGAPPTRAEFCSAKGVGGIQLPNSKDCTGDIAKKLFRFGICSCEGFNTPGTVKTASFDSMTMTSNRKGGSIGTNGEVHMVGLVDIGGSVITSQIAAFNQGGRIAQDLRAGLGASATSALAVDGDYFGGTDTNRRVTVSGATNVPAAVPPPCDCSGSKVPIAAYVAAFAANNDNAASGLTSQSLVSHNGGADITLECGRYYFDEISSLKGTTIRIKGRTAIFVAGDVRTTGDLSFVFGPDAELDLFVVGDLGATGSTKLGNFDAPARARMYVAGSSVGTTGDFALSANLYAPNARVHSTGKLTVRGAVYAREVGVTGGLDLNYDEAILNVQGCGGPGGECATCGDCSGKTPACTGGKCQACRTSAECCPPLVCAADGSCVAYSPR
jgi:hypothetical protein